MSREIKFRAWCSTDEQMYTIEDFGDVYFGLCNDGTMELIDCCSDEPQELKAVFMQYTGLKDKNGVEIYEGDIIKSDRNCFRNEGYTVRAVEFRDGEFCTTGSLMNTVTSFNPEIVGNIHESPELIGG